jgi:sterol desaturase/sphingolipid hydroxylase (fatty acid hydroxylase superfamily)
MNESWRIPLLAAWLLILWTAESVIPLKPNNRKHLWTNLSFTTATVIINALLAGALIKVIFICNTLGIGLFNNVSTPFYVQIIIGLFFLDFVAAYLSHRLMHKFNLLWSFHQVHHLDEMIDATTGLRQHPLETIYRFMFLIIGVVTLGAPLMVVVIYQTISATNALLEHSNVKMNPNLNKALSIIFVTPNFHKVHHSLNSSEADHNYGNIFSIWDIVLSTRKSIDLMAMSYGLDHPLKSAQSAKNLLLLPFLKIKNRQDAKRQ